MRNIVSPLDGIVSAFGGRRFDPRSLFGLGEPGIWLDPSDLSTMFQDSAGTTPVTAPGDPVGLVLDKSKNLTLGSERITNGDFANGTTGWTITAAGVNTISVADGAFTLTATGSSDTATITQAWLGASANGKTYEISFEVLAGSSGTIKITTLGINNTIGEHSFSATVGVKTFRLVSATSSSIGFSRATGSAATAIITNISIREIPGNHARQSTAAARPTYAVVPLGGRRNLLTYSEQIDNAAWTKQRATVSSNTTTAPDGTATADSLVDNGVSGTHRVLQSATKAASALPYTGSIYIKAGTLGFATIRLAGTSETAYTSVGIDLTTGDLSSFSTSGFTGVSAAAEDAGNGWWRLSITGTTDTTSTVFLILGTATTLTPSSSYVGSGDHIYVWGGQIEEGSTATAYQKVVSQYDVTEAGTVSLSYLSFDGVDDFLVTPTITPGTDKVQVFAGVRKLSDAAAGVVAELSVSSSANNGAFYLLAPNASGRKYDFRSKGTVAAEAFTLSASYAAPVTNVLTGLGDISGDSAILRVNGAVADTDTADQGTGNYLAYAIYIGRRGGTTLPFSGGLYGQITRFGAALSEGQITSSEQWLNAKTGAY